MAIEFASKSDQVNSNIYSNGEMSSMEKVVDDVEVKDRVETQVGEKEVSENDIKKAIKKINTFLQDENTHAEYSMHKGLSRIMIKIVDNDTKKVVLELPPEKLVDMVSKMCELAGVLVDKKA